MRIAILHRIPYHKVGYHQVIDHERHEVVYLGSAAQLADIPPEARHEKVVLQGGSREEAILHAMAQFKPMDQVIARSEYDLLTAAKARERFGIPGRGVAETLLVRDKIAMKQAAMAQGIRVPRFMEAAPAASGDIRLLMDWRGAVVLKPRDGASSVGVEVLSGVDALQARLKAMTPAELSGYEIEEFIPGSIYHVDGLMQAGQPLSMMASEYLGTCLEYVAGKPFGSLQLVPDPDLYRWATAPITAVGIGDGSFHLELIASADGPVFLEIGARAGGAEVVRCHELKTGVNLHHGDISLLINGDIGSVPTLRPEYFGWFVFPAHHLGGGRLMVSGVEAFKHHPFLVKWFEREPERPLPHGVTYQSDEVAAAGIVGGRDRASLRRFMLTILDSVKVSAA